MIKVDSLKKTYDRRTRNANTVLHGLSFTLPDTGFICILGASGCGKTSLLNAIGGLDAFDSGTITTDDARITRSGSRAMENERNANFGYIFQNYYLLSEHSAAYNIYLGMHSMPLTKKEKMKRVKDALGKVDMLRYRKRAVGQLSGGQQQRIAIARAIARDPKVIFADEPTGNLDEVNTMNICTMLKELSRESLVVMVTHEERIARFFADRIITLEDGRIIDDSTDWSRGTLDAGEKDALYSGEYEESRAGSEKIDIRLLAKEGASPFSLTVITEKDRIIIKTNDPRVVLTSEMNASPRLYEGERPVLSADSFSVSEAEKKQSDHPSDGKKSSKNGLGMKFLLREARSLVSSKRLGKLGMGVFIILLSLMISLAVSDIITIASIDPEDFIITDSHMLEFSFERGPDLPREVWDIDPYVGAYWDHIEASGLDFDYVINTGRNLVYSDSSVPQLGDLSMKFTPAVFASLSRLDESTLISGRMPERSDEIIVDRWLIDKYLEEDGILQNVIPNRDYFIGKTLSNDHNTGYMLKIVGICDSGEPVIYMGKAAMLSHSPGGMQVMPFDEFCKLTGYDKCTSLAIDECIVLADNAGIVYTTYIGDRYYFSEGSTFYIKDAVTETDESLTAKYVMSDETIDLLYQGLIESYGEVSIWCADKPTMLEYIGKEMPEELSGMITVETEDKYQASYDKYSSAASIKADARTIVTVTVFILSTVMLYLMQRSKINERMDLVAVYRLLGIPKRNLVFIFAVESITVTLKYAVPAVFGAWIAINALTSAESIDFSMLFPLSAVGITLAAILVLRVIFAVLPVLRLLSEPPARLAAKYDF